MNGRGWGAQALVIGGGVVGLTTAVSLLDAGFQVTLLERVLVGREASWAGGGILSPLYPWREPIAVQDLAAESVRLYPELAASLARDTGIDPEWTCSGLRCFGIDSAEQEKVLAWAAQSAVEVDALTNFRGRQALHFPRVAQIRNPRLCQALAKQLRMRGGLIVEDCQVDRIASMAGHFEVLAGARSWRSDLVVLCAGAWTASLAATLGWSIPVTPVKGQMILLRGTPGLLDTILLESGRYLIPRRDGHILIGSTVEPVGFDRGVTVEAALALRAFATDMLPETAELPMTGHWMGLRPAAPDGLPLIARHPELKGLYVNSGHHRNGLTLAPASAGRLMSLISAD